MGCENDWKLKTASDLSNLVSMTNRFVANIALTTMALLLFGNGCGKPPAAAQPVNPFEPTQAQPKLQTTKLWLGAEELETELALTEEQQHIGMMFRTNMAENAGMLFVFPWPHQTSFWMKNTIVPLSAAYIDPDGVILEIHDLKPHDTNSVVAASNRIQFVLEVNQGWFSRHNVKTGAVVRSEKGPLRDMVPR
jgi:uncharacterized membrane protein (UPF0127 family)